MFPKFETQKTRRVRSAIFLCLICSMFIISFAQLYIAHAYKPWGILTPDMRYRIQVFYSPSSERDVRIPQDSNTLPFDHFYLWVSFLYFQDNVSLTVTIYEYNKTAQQNVTKGSQTITIQRGLNEFNDPTMSIVKIDSNTLPFFQTVERPEYVTLKYEYKIWDPENRTYVEDEFILSFIHRTDPSLVPREYTLIDITVREWFVTITAILAFAASILFASWLYKRAGGVYPSVPLSLILLVLSWGFGAWIIYLLVKQFSRDEIVRIVLTIPPYLGIIGASIITAVWIPGLFKQAGISQTLFLEIDIPSEEELLERDKDMDIVPHTFYRFIDKKGRRVYVEDPDSYVDLLRRVMRGGIRFLTPERRNAFRETFVKQSKKSDWEVVFCRKLSKRHERLEGKEWYQRPGYVAMLVFGGIGIITFAMTFFSWLFNAGANLEFIGLILAISLLGLIVSYIFEKSRDVYTWYELVPMKREEVQAIMDVLFVDKMIDALREASAEAVYWQHETKKAQAGVFHQWLKDLVSSFLRLEDLKKKREERERMKQKKILEEMLDELREEEVVVD